MRDLWTNHICTTTQSWIKVFHCKERRRTPTVWIRIFINQHQEIRCKVFKDPKLLMRETNLLACIGKRLSSMLKVKPACTRETGASWNDTNHVSTHSGTESNRPGKKRSHFSRRKESRCWTESGRHFGDFFKAGSTPLKLASRKKSHVLFDIVIKMNESKMELYIGTQYSGRWRGCSKINWKTKAKAWIGSNTLITGATKQDLKFVKKQMTNWFTFEGSKDIQAEWLFSQNWWITYWFPTSENNSSTIWVVPETDIRLRKLDWWQEVKKLKKGRQTIFFTPLDPYHSDASEAESSTDLSKSRKVHYQTQWRPEQDVVYWINFPERKTVV